MRRKSDAMEVQAVAERIKSLLAGQPPDIQGAALADLLAAWLCGHIAGERTAEFREEMLQLHCHYVRQLIPVNEQELLANDRNDRSHAH